MTRHIDWKGLSSYLIVTFAITYAIELALILSHTSPIVKGFGQYVVAGVMWVPALATVVTVKFVTHEGFGIANIRVGDWRPYVASALMLPGGFLLIYAVTWALGLGQPDWALSEFRKQFAAAGLEAPRTPAPALLWPALFLAMTAVAPFVNALFGFGEELGWRGYLLPKLLPLGKVWAYVLLGIVWGLWHAPLVFAGFMYPGHPLSGTLMFIGLTTTLGIYMNELTLRHRSSVLAGWIHGVFNSQRLGVWALLFPVTTPWLGGYAGAVGLTMWLLLGLWAVRRGTPRALDARS